MRDIPKLFFRLALFTVLPLTAAAIVLGRMNPEQPVRRIESASGYQVVSNFPTTHMQGPQLLNVSTGRLEALPTPAGIRMSVASLSPWEEEGQRQLVGIGWSHSEGTTAAGIVRVSLPGGEVLDRLPLDQVAIPVGPPCWLRGVRAGVLYPGGDGRIYRVDFETPRPDGSVERVANPEPEPLNWQTPMPGPAGEVLVRDLTWPDDARLGGRALASLCMKDPKTGRFNDWQIWWLKLDDDATAVVAAGRLLEAGPTEHGSAIRLPNLVGDIDGAPTLAYLAQVLGQPGYQLRVTPLRFDAGSGVPRAHEYESRVLADDCIATTPSASPDGRWVIAVRLGIQKLKTERVLIAGRLPLAVAMLDAGLGRRSDLAALGTFMP